MTELRLLPGRVFDGIVPATVATCSAEGIPNVAVLSHVHRIDDHHVALSRQFFNKTTRNILVNPQALITLWDPVDFLVYRLRARHLRSETEGPTFDFMALRIDAIAAHTGMKGIFKLLASDVFEVSEVSRVDDHLGPAITCPLGEEELSTEPLEEPPEAREELWVLQRLSHRINRAHDRRALFAEVLEGLAEDFGFEHAKVLLCRGDRLVTVASRGYPPGGSEEVALGEGLVGGAAKERRILRLSCLGTELRYGQSVRKGYAADGVSPSGPGVPLPGLPDAQSHLAIPLVMGERLLGVLALESRNPSTFESWHEAFLGVVADQIASGIERLPAADDDGCVARLRRHFVFYRNDDAVFVDDEYLIRNVPGRILWRLLSCHAESGRTEFTNRELRLDPSLGLPPLKDNLESRLILLRKRLEEKCPEVRLPRRGRGRFGLELDCEAALEERESAAL